MLTQEHPIPKDYLLISKINTVVFCPRRYFIEVVLSENMNNYHLIDGTALHERTKREGESWVWNDRLGIVGIADQIKREDGVLVPYEFKKGFLAKHSSDQAQLCALAMCIEERTGERLERGYIYYHKNRRRIEVVFDSVLRAEVEEAIQTMRMLNDNLSYPPVTSIKSKCKGCSVYEACQPTL